MKKPNNKTQQTPEGFELRVRARRSKTLNLRVPVEVAKSLERVASSRDMSGSY